MAKARSPRTIDPQEADHFGRLAADWWDPKGGSAMLHQLNPVRLAYLRERIDDHWQGDPTSLRPLAGRSALDVGCGAGLLAEPLARMGAKVTGVDGAREVIAVAADHAKGQGLAIDYRCGEFADLGGCFDLVTAMEVIEHVTAPGHFLAALADRLAPDGLLVLSTPNRTGLSRLAMITLGEGLGRIPRGTHDWDKFLTPDELTAHAQAAGLRVVDCHGIGFSPGKGLHLTTDLALNYMMALVKA